MNLGEVIGMFGIIAAFLVAWWFYVLSEKVLNRIDNMTRRINAILIARMSPEEYKQAERLIDDIVTTGEKRGTLVQLENGSYGIRFVQNFSVSRKVTKVVE